MKKGWVRKLWGAPIETQIASLRDYGVAERNIYVDGRGAEDLPALFRSLRPGDEVCIAADLRVFGSSRKEILLVTGQFESEGLKLTDAAHPEDATLSKKIDRAVAELAKYARWEGSKASARKTGRKGGKAKGEASQERRNAILHEDIVRRLCEAPELSWRRRAEILGKPWSVATLRRHYGKIK